jgi:lipopolysaccharide export system protein LptA
MRWERPGANWGDETAVTRWWVVVLIVAAPDLLHAQSRERCDFINTGQTRIQRNTLPSGESNTFIGAGVRVRCPRSDITLIADSLESYGEEGRIYLVGNVHYDEPRLNLTSNFLTYFVRDERLVATGNVVAKLPSGSTMRGPMAEYYRVIPRVRPATRLYSTGKPHFTIQQRDSAGRPAPPVEVDAFTVNMVGDSLVYASGQAVVTRHDIIARADSMHIDTEREITILLRSPSIEGRRDRPFTLFGDRIVLTGKNRKLDRVVSTSRARAVSQDMTLTSDTIDLRVMNDLLQRAVAWGTSRARASSATQQIVADSIDVVMPNQRVREMHALRKAIAEGRPDSTRFKADTVNWLRGDTIIARFDTLTARDTARTVQLRELVSRGNAKAYYHIAPADTSQRVPAINYVVGREITISMRQQEVSRVTVLDQAAGVYLEPKVAASRADTTQRRGARPAIYSIRSRTRPRPPR